MFLLFPKLFCQVKVSVLHCIAFKNLKWKKKRGNTAADTVRLNRAKPINVSENFLHVFRNIWNVGAIICRFFCVANRFEYQNEISPTWNGTTWNAVAYAINFLWMFCIFGFSLWMLNRFFSFGFAKAIADYILRR